MSKLQVTEVDGVNIVTVTIRHIASDEEVHEISKEIKGLMSPMEERKILLNMEQVEAMASLMVGELIMLKKIFDKNEAVFRICSLSPIVGESLKISGLCDLLPIDENQEASLAKFKS